MTHICVGHESAHDVRPGGLGIRVLAPLLHESQMCNMPLTMTLTMTMKNFDNDNMWQRFICNIPNAHNARRTVKPEKHVHEQLYCMRDKNTLQ